MSALRLEVRRLDAGLPLPTHQRAGDAGVDLSLASDVRLDAGERTVVGTGLAVAVPEGYVGLVAPRSGLAVRCGLSLTNSLGVIDSGYRGEVKLILQNLDPKRSIALVRGERVAQLLLVPVATVECVEVDELPPTERGKHGHGSTGT